MPKQHSSRLNPKDLSECRYVIVLQLGTTAELPFGSYLLSGGCGEGVEGCEKGGEVDADFGGVGVGGGGVGVGVAI